MIDFFIKMGIGVLAGILSSMGLGAGTVLILYLVLFTQTEQIVAQGMNLLFFVPIATLSICLHIKNNLITDKKTSFKISAVACIGAIIGCFVATKLSAEWLGKAFAVFLFFIGLKDLFAKREPTPCETDESKKKK